MGIQRGIVIQKELVGLHPLANINYHPLPGNYLYCLQGAIAMFNA